MERGGQGSGELNVSHNVKSNGDTFATNGRANPNLYTCVCKKKKNKKKEKSDELLNRVVLSPCPQRAQQ